MKILDNNQMRVKHFKKEQGSNKRMNDEDYRKQPRGSYNSEDLTSKTH